MSIQVQSLQVKQPTLGEARFVRQRGGLHRYGHVVLVVESCNMDVLEIIWEVPESAIPAEFRQAVLRGIHGVFEPEAKYAAFTSSGLKVKIVGGSYHDTDSNEGSYEIAGGLAFINAITTAGAANDT
jgi:elongation factor G